MEWLGNNFFRIGKLKRCNRNRIGGVFAQFGKIVVGIGLGFESLMGRLMGFGEFGTLVGVWL